MNLLRPLALLSLGLLSTSAHAVLVIDSFSGSSNGNSAASGPTAGFFFPGTYTDREAAIDFNTGNNAAWLNELQLNLAIGNNATALTASLSTGNTAPVSNSVLIGNVTPASALPTIQTVSFQPAANSILLSPNTRYWIHLTVASGDGIYSLAYSDTQSNAAGWSLDETWAFTPASAPPPNGWNQDATTGVAKVRMDVSFVPEPSTAILGSAGMLLLLHRRTR